MASQSIPKVIIIGAGFGGLFAAKTLANQPVDVLLIDRHNYHTFTPLLYQVATSALDPSSIAYPVRKIFSGNANVRCVMGEVTAIHPVNKTVEILIDGMSREESFDDLIIATGSKPSYFGNEHFQEHVFDLRTLSDAVRLRNHILRTFEMAAWFPDPVAANAFTQYVVIGGGPTGLETAGALYELLNRVLTSEYKKKGQIKAEIYLVELLPNLLDTYPEKLQQSALRQLRDLGVNVILDNGVQEITEDGIQLRDGTRLTTRTIIWAAGVQGIHPPVANLSFPDKIPVKLTLETIEFKNIYAVGDTAYLPEEAGTAYPMVIPVAQQQGILAAKNILRGYQGKTKQPFQYYDRGSMATIGRKRAVAWIYNRVPISGFLAWLAWLFLHFVTLIGFRNKLVVLISWIWSYFTLDRSVRIILDLEVPEPIPDPMNQKR